MKIFTRNFGARTNALLGVADQGISSVTNFGAVVIVAGASSTQDFGAYSVAYLTYSIVVAGFQSVIGQELVLTTGTRTVKWTRCRDALLFAAVLGLAVGLLVVAAGLAIPSVRGVLFVLGLLMPLLMVQDSLRFCASLLGCMQLAVVCDFVWLILAGISMALVVSTSGAPSPTSFALAWCASGGAAGLLCLGPLVGLGKDLPRPTLHRFRHRQYLGYRFVWEFLAIRAAGQGLTLGLGGLAGLGAAGALRGATTLFGPMNVLILATMSFGVPIVRSLNSHRKDVLVLVLACLLAGVSTGLTVVLWMLPVRLGEAVLGDTWRLAHSVIPAVGTQTALGAVAAVAFMVIRMEEPRATFVPRIIAAVLVFPAFFIGFAQWGYIGAAWGLTVAAALQALLGAAVCLRMWARSGGGFLIELEDGQSGGQRAPTTVNE